MVKLFKLLVFATFVAMFVWFGANVKLGKHTLFGHVSRIWKTEETQDLVEGTKDTAQPAIDKIKRGVKAGVREARRAAESNQAQ